MDRRLFLKRAGTASLWTVLFAPSVSKSRYSKGTSVRPRLALQSGVEAAQRRGRRQSDSGRFSDKRLLVPPQSADCKALFANLRNPYYIGDHPGVTQTLGGSTRGPPNPAFTPSPQEMPTISPQL